MRTRPHPALTAAALLCLAAGAARSNALTDEMQAVAEREALAQIVQLPNIRACDAPAEPGHARCQAHIVTDANGTPVGSPILLGGLKPADITSAYNIPAAGGNGVTVALVDANDDPNAENDLAVYRAQFGLPACTTGNGCFKKVNEKGQASPLPKSDDGWSAEITLDLDAVSAACPNCKILLVEADSTSTLDLGAAVVTAASMGAAAISNSYGGDENFAETVSDSTYYHHPGILITASTGDDGYGTEYPAASQYVLAVGGTSLVKTGVGSRGWVESAWSKGGSGCSDYEPKPSWQTGSACSKRSVADVSAVGDPNTGLAVYDTFGSGTGWMIYGGTSLSSPLVAAIFAHVGAGGVTNQFPYANTGAFYDATLGSNGSCGGTYLCTAGTGYDGPTGIGSPDAAEISSIVGTGGGGSGGGSGGGTGSACGPDSVDILGACIPDFGCNSTGQEGSVAWLASALFAGLLLWRANKSRAARS